MFTEREQETVLEGEPIGTPVTRVNAIDKDGTFPNNQVYYYIVDSQRFDKTLNFYMFDTDAFRNEGLDYFEINSQTGEVFTKAVFDRDKRVNLRKGMERNI